MTVAKNGGDDVQQLVHDSHESNLARLTGADEALVEGAQLRVGSGGGERGHVERMANGSPTTADEALAVQRAAVGGIGSNAN